ncbi:uncharacterized protein LOC115883377 [Sitophilus oryzae]|uniref:Uncharacterized protein LOC115883377 n=1 Tax=Sitophilus oryzae TaxID=7048 RepID=A0A6J2Y1L6_SITOR|nr:uncharacterized protein LOC115883377 [Sitophilus oryzae]
MLEKNLASRPLANGLNLTFEFLLYHFGVITVLRSSGGGYYMICNLIWSNGCCGNDCSSKSTIVLIVAQLILGIVTVGMVSYYIQKYQNMIQTPELFFLIVATIFMAGTFFLLLSCLLSIATASILPKTIYEVIYHGFAFLFLLAAGLTFVVYVNQKKNSYYYDYDAYLAAAILGLVNAALYLGSTIFALRTYRGL